MHDEPRHGWLRVDFLDIQIQSRLEKYRFHSVYLFAEIRKVPPTASLNHLRDTLGMKHFHLRWISDQLTEQLRARVPLLEGMKVNTFRNVATGDES
jgi:hypothetical protein